MQIAKIHSKAFSALTLDSFLDLAITAVAIISLTVSSIADYAVDAIIGIVLSILIVVFGIKMIMDAVRSLVGKSATDSQIEKIESILTEDKSVKKVGQIKLHDYGYENFLGTAEIEFENLELTQALAKCSELEKLVREGEGFKLDLIIKKGIDKDYSEE